MKKLVVDQLKIEVKYEPELIITWLGASTGLDPKSQVDPFFAEILDDYDGDSVVIDFTDLEYINSTTVPTIMRLVRKLSGMNIETRIIYNTRLRWQVISFRALESLSRVLKNVTVEGR